MAHSVSGSVCEHPTYKKIGKAKKQDVEDPSVEKVLLEINTQIG